jgi:hypothetical protein
MHAYTLDGYMLSVEKKAAICREVNSSDAEWGFDPVYHLLISSYCGYRGVSLR